MTYLQRHPKIKNIIIIILMAIAWLGSDSIGNYLVPMQ